AASGRDAILQFEIVLGPVIAGVQQFHVRLNDAGVLFAECEGDLFARELQVKAVDIAQHSQCKHVLAAPGVGDDRAALAFHRNFVNLESRRHELVVGLGVGGGDVAVRTLAPHAFQQNNAARLEFAGVDAAEQYLLVEGDHQVGFVAAVGDTTGAQTNAISTAAGDAARGRADFRGDDLHGPDTIARTGGDRSERLSAALRALARVADDLDDMLVQRDSRLPDGSGLSRLGRTRVRLNGDFGNGFVHLVTLCGANPRVVALPEIDPEERADVGFVDIVDAGITNSQIVLDAARGFAAGTHRLDHRRRAGDDIAAGKHACHQGRQRPIGLDIAAL